MTKVPSKLYRSTASLPRPLIRVQVGEYSEVENTVATLFTDDDIQSVKIIHGTSDPEPSVTPARCEIHIKGEWPVMHGEILYVFGPSAIKDPGAQNNAGSQWRFCGRVTTQTVYKGQTPEKSHTVIQASSYVALGTGSNLTVGIGTDWSMRTVLGHLVGKMQAISDGEVQYTEPYIYAHETTHATEWTTLSSALKKYVSDVGYRTHILRSGWLEFRDLNRLQWEVEDTAKNVTTLSGEELTLVYPIERRQVLAPMDLVQTTENNKIGVKMKRRDGDGVLKEGIWTFGEGWQETDDPTVTEWVEVDWSHIRWTSPHYRNAINAEASRLFRSAYYSPHVKMDMLQLLRPLSPSGSETSGRTIEEHIRDQYMAAGLYRLEVGDMIPFGRDWEHPYRGVKYVTGFTETITPDEWTFDLSVHPPQHIVGRYGVADDPEPEITSYPWDRYDAGFNTFTDIPFTEMTGYTFDQFRDLGD